MVAVPVLLTSHDVVVGGEADVRDFAADAELFLALLLLESAVNCYPRLTYLKRQRAFRVSYLKYCPDFLARSVASVGDFLTIVLKS